MKHHLNINILFLKGKVKLKIIYYINTLPNDKNVDFSKVKAFANNKSNVTQKLKFALGKGRKYCGKRRKCWIPAFSPFPTIFSKGFFLRVVKSWDCVIKN